MRIRLLNACHWCSPFFRHHSHIISQIHSVSFCSKSFGMHSFELCEADQVKTCVPKRMYFFFTYMCDTVCIVLSPLEKSVTRDKITLSFSKGMNKYLNSRHTVFFFLLTAQKKRNDKNTYTFAHYTYQTKISVRMFACVCLCRFVINRSYILWKNPIDEKWANIMQ